MENTDQTATAGTANALDIPSNAESGDATQSLAKRQGEILVFLLAQTGRLGVQRAVAQGNTHFAQRLLGQSKDVVAQDPTYVSAESCLQRALASLARLEQIIAQTRIAAEVWAESWHLEPVATDLRKPLQEALQLVRSELPHQQITEYINLPKESDVIVNCDVELLRVLFVEVLRYALDQSFTPLAELAASPVWFSLQRETTSIGVFIAYTHRQQTVEWFSKRSLPQKIIHLLGGELEQSHVGGREYVIVITLPLTLDERIRDDAVL